MTVAERFDLEAYLDRERNGVEAALARAVEAAAEDLPPSLAGAVEHGVMGGGKRIRPLLCVAAYRACGGPPSDAVYDLAASLELIHAYSLMHDDLPCMDDAALRRGRSTTHRVHGEATTVVAGAALIPLAARAAWRALGSLGRADAAAEAVSVLCRAAGAEGMVGGQALDLLGEGRRLEPDELDRLHRLKTGALLAASLDLGALAAAADDREREALATYGRAVGLAFQIADDVLDATASAEELGKNPSDAELDKSTWVAVHGLDEARRRAREEAARARNALGSAGLDAPALHALADYVVRRTR